VNNPPEMKIKAIAPWFGGKRTLAPAIVEELGRHTQYFEPFCGSMAVLFAKSVSQKETVNDLHGDLTNLARVIQDDDLAPELYNRLQRVLFSEGLLKEAADLLEANPSPAFARADADRAYWYFLACWMQRNGIAGTSTERGHGYAIAVRWTGNGGSPTVRFANSVDSIPAWHHRLKNVVILRRDAFEWLPRVEDVEATAIYADPPYPAESRSGWEATGATSRYAHEFEHSGGSLFGASDDHARLADLLRGFKKARIVVSSYDCPRYRQLYKGWTFIEKTMQKKLHGTNGKAVLPDDAPEVLIINGLSLAKGAA
jgi:DNA adenine methylase